MMTRVAAITMLALLALIALDPPTPLPVQPATTADGPSVNATV